MLRRKSIATMTSARCFSVRPLPAPAIPHESVRLTGSQKGKDDAPFLLKSLVRMRSNARVKLQTRLAAAAATESQKPSEYVNPSLKRCTTPNHVTLAMAMASRIFPHGPGGQLRVSTGSTSDEPTHRETDHGEPRRQAWTVLEEPKDEGAIGQDAEREAEGLSDVEQDRVGLRVNDRVALCLDVPRRREPWDVEEDRKGAREPADDGQEARLGLDSERIVPAAVRRRRLITARPRWSSLEKPASDPARHALGLATLLDLPLPLLVDLLLGGIDLGLLVLVLVLTIQLLVVLDVVLLGARGARVAARRGSRLGKKVGEGDSVERGGRYASRRCRGAHDAFERTVVSPMRACQRCEGSGRKLSEAAAQFVRGGCPRPPCSSRFRA